MTLDVARHVGGSRRPCTQRGLDIADGTSKEDGGEPADRFPTIKINRGCLSSGIGSDNEPRHTFYFDHPKCSCHLLLFQS